MRIVNIEETQWHTGPGHRDPGLHLRDVLAGVDGGSGNYWLSIIKVEERYDAPPHRHNFEQVRVMLEGTFNFGPQDQEAGTVGYFCEGTTYTQSARGPSVTLLLQCEGGSGARYLSQSEIRKGVLALQGSGGSFDGGRYAGPDPVSGAWVEKDSYEAIWEQVAGQRLAYSKPRYQGPVIMDPAASAYLPASGVQGVLEKNLGVFNERKLAIAFWKFEANGRRTYASPAKTLFYLGSGEVLLNGEKFGPNAAAEVLEGEEAEFLHLAGEPEILVLRLSE